MNFLPGWNPGLFSVGGAVTITQVASATSITGTITAPANIQAGDLLVIVQRATRDTSTPPAAVTPSGFLTANNVSNSTGGKKPFACRQIINYKLAVGTEASSSLSVMTGSDVDLNPDQRSIMLVFRPSVPAASIALGDADGQITNADPTLQTITSGSGVSPLVVIASSGSAGGVDATFHLTPLEDGEVLNSGGDNGISIMWKIYNTSPVNVTTDVGNVATDNTLQSMYFQVS